MTAHDLIREHIGTASIYILANDLCPICSTEKPPKGWTYAIVLEPPEHKKPLYAFGLCTLCTMAAQEVM